LNTESAGTTWCTDKINPVNGNIVYNKTTGTTEMYTGNSWHVVAGGGLSRSAQDIVDSLRDIEDENFQIIMVGLDKDNIHLFKNPTKKAQDLHNLLWEL